MPTAVCVVRTFIVQLPVSFLHWVYNMSCRSFLKCPLKCLDKFACFLCGLNSHFPCHVFLSILHFWTQNLQTPKAVHPGKMGNSTSLQIMCVSVSKHDLTSDILFMSVCCLSFCFPFYFQSLQLFAPDSLIPMTGPCLRVRQWVIPYFLHLNLTLTSHVFSSLKSQHVWTLFCLKSKTEKV